MTTTITKLSTLLTNLKTKVKKLFNRRSPRFLQETKDNYVSILAYTYKQHRLKQLSNISSHSTSSFRRLGKRQQQQESKEERETLYDDACDELERRLVHKMTIKELREVIQNEYGPEVIRILETFRDVETLILEDDDLGSERRDEYDEKRRQWLKEDDDDNGRKEYSWEGVVKDVLLKEYEDVCRDVHSKDEKTRNAMPFLIRKQGALHSVLDYKQWPIPSDMSQQQSFLRKNHIFPTSDPFGIPRNIPDDKLLNTIRLAQIVNLTKNALLRQKLGYSALTLQSTIPQAGKGLFVDGFAHAGSIVAFFPGDVWPREHLIQSSISSHFEQDDNHQLSLRYDDIILDSRKSPYIILDSHHSNPWSLAHIANHPPPPSSSSNNTSPNCGILMLNYTTEIGLTPQLQTFIPNTYAKKPMLISQNTAFEHDDVYMHGMILVTIKDVWDEELFYNYRFNSVDRESWPDWYHVCDEEEAKNRWSD